MTLVSVALSPGCLPNFNVGRFFGPEGSLGGKVLRVLWTISTWESTETVTTANVSTDHAKAASERQRRPSHRGHRGTDLRGEAILAYAPFREGVSVTALLMLSIAMLLSLRRSSHDRLRRRARP